jgi:asparagine synthetase B (glutamine-hydrolysing)
VSLAVTPRDWHGIERRYVRAADGRVEGSLAALAIAPLALDRVGIEAGWGLRDAPERTVLAGVEQAPTRTISPRPGSPWVEALESDVAAIARSARAPALALGGGLDAAVVLAAWRATGLPIPTVVTLSTGLPTYDEVEAATTIAAALGMRCEPVHITPERLLQRLPWCVAAIEAPLYNLHPVGRLALAAELRSRGHDVLVTGDGADACFRGRPDLDYVPLMAALTTAAGLALRSPFLREDTLAATLAQLHPVDASAPDPGKHATRAYAAAAGLPDVLTTAPKQPRWLPPLDLGGHLDTRVIARLGREIGIAPALDSDRARVGWSTLSLLVSHLARA